jgi:hypothetical protein
MPEERQYAPCPTRYAGRLFRSRLEAKWASFFDSLGWKWEYEPERIDAWMPDFLLFGIKSRRIYVEVKPDHLMRHAYGKVSDAMRRFAWGRAGLVVGEAPRFDIGVCLGEIFSENDEGYETDTVEHSWGDANLVCERRYHPLQFDIISNDIRDDCFLAPGNETGKHVTACGGEEIREIWNRAATKVMWVP